MSIASFCMSPNSFEIKPSSPPISDQNSREFPHFLQNPLGFLQFPKTPIPSSHQIRWFYDHRSNHCLNQTKFAQVHPPIMSLRSRVNPTRVVRLNRVGTLFCSNSKSALMVKREVIRPDDSLRVTVDPLEIPRLQMRQHYNDSREIQSRWKIRSYGGRKSGWRRLWRKEIWMMEAMEEWDQGDGKFVMVERVWRWEFQRVADGGWCVLVP